jgi:hypothetical protein
MKSQRHALAAPYTPGKTRYPLYRKLGGRQGRSGKVRKFSPALGFDPRTVQPVGSRYTDNATGPTLAGFRRKQTHVGLRKHVEYSAELNRAQAAGRHFAYTRYKFNANILILGGRGEGELLQHYVWTQPLLPTEKERLKNLIDFPLTKRQSQLHSFAEKELRQLVINIICILYSEVRNNAN